MITLPCDSSHPEKNDKEASTREGIGASEERNSSLALLDQYTYIYHLNNTSPYHSSIISSSSSSSTGDSPPPVSSDVLENNDSKTQSHSSNTSALVLSDKPSKGRVIRPKRPETFEKLNWCDADQLDRYQEMMHPEMTDAWRIRNTKAAPEFSRFYSPEYIASLCPLIASNSRYAKKVAYCMNEMDGKRTACLKWNLCDRCAQYKASQQWRIFDQCFNADFTFYSVTLSFDGSIPFSSTSATNCRLYWDANTQLVRSCLKSHLIRGAYLAHEIKLSQFLPLRVNPHSHVIMASDEGLETVQEQLQEFLKDAGLDRAPSVKIKPLPSVEDLERAVKYLTKAVDFVSPYESAWHLHVSNDPAQAMALNVEMKEFFDAHQVAFDGLKKVSRYGNLCGSSSSYIGKSPSQIQKEIDAQKEARKAYLQKINKSEQPPAKPKKVLWTE